jgi:hypothetical protein
MRHAEQAFANEHASAAPRKHALCERACWRLGAELLPERRMRYGCVANVRRSAAGLSRAMPARRMRGRLALPLSRRTGRAAQRVRSRRGPLSIRWRVHTGPRVFAAWTATRSLHLARHLGETSPYPCAFTSFAQRVRRRECVRLCPFTDPAQRCGATSYRRRGRARRVLNVRASELGATVAVRHAHKEPV